MNAPRVALVTNMPSYHQIDLFNAIAAARCFPFRVFYLRRITPGRQWTHMGREIRHDAVFVRELPVHPYFYLNWGFRRALTEYGADLYVVTQYASIAMQLLMWAATLRRRPWIFWSEAGGVEFAEQPIVQSDELRRWLRRVALAPVRLGADEIWGVGSRGERYYEQIAAAPVRRFSYYADLTPFLALKRATEEGPLRFLCLGKLNQRKGVDVLVRAFRMLDLPSLDVALTVAGDGPLRPDVERLAAELPERVSYVGFRQLDEIPALLAAADVLVCPSRFDGWGMVVLEAMAAGLPVISTTATTAAVDLIADTSAGWLVSAGDAAALAAAMEEAARARRSLRERSAQARERAREYDAERGAEHFCNLIESFWARRGAS